MREVRCPDALMQGTRRTASSSLLAFRRAHGLPYHEVLIGWQCLLSCVTSVRTPALWTFSQRLFLADLRRMENGRDRPLLPVRL
jgi:hypothetical protein